MPNTQSSNVARIHDDAPLAPVIHHYEEASWFESIPGERLALRVHSSQVNGRYSIMSSIAAPGSATPLHTHAEDEIFYIISGVLTFAVEDEIVEVRPGGVVAVTAGTRHSWKNRSQDDVHMLVMFAPGGIEDLFSTLSGLSPEQMEARVAQYGSIILGPPLEG